MSRTPLAFGMLCTVLLLTEAASAYPVPFPPPQGPYVVVPPMFYPPNVLVNPTLATPPVSPATIPAPGGPFSINSFFDVFTEISLDGGTTWTTHSTVAPVSFDVYALPGGPPFVLPVEMISLDISGGTLPSGMMIRESPTQPSAGFTTYEPIGGGQFRIDSFFDVFTELSLDGGATWIPSSGPSRMSTQTPEPSSIALFTMGALGMVMLRKRRRAA